MCALLFSKTPTFESQDYKSLLVVDSSPLHSRIFKKMFGILFESVLKAATAEQAEKILESETVSHLVISNRIASGISTSDLIAQWKFLYPTISRVILFTGASPNDIDFSVEIDAVVTKPAQVDALREAVLGHFPE